MTTVGRLLSHCRNTTHISAEMSLQLSAHKSRQLQYCQGGLRCDLKLMEVDEKLLQAIINQEPMVIKGETTDDAVLCTSSKTYALKLVETTNTLLLLPPTLEELDGEFAATPSLTPPAAGDAGAGVRDIGLQTQLQKNAAAQGFPPLTATATATSHIELVEIAPNLDQLPKLLGERPYSLEDEDDPAAAAGDDAMDVDGAAGSSSRRPPGCFTTRELLQKVQASEAELLAELSRLKALLLGGLWRRVDESYLGGLLEMMVACAHEHGWSMQAIPLQDAVAALQPEGYLPELVQHCLQVFGRPARPPGAAAAAGPGSSQQDDSAAAAAGSSGQDPSSSSSSSSHYALDEQEVCLQYARKLLSRRPEWQADEFLAAWQAAVPDCWQPCQEMLLGEALLLQPDAGEGYSEPRLRHFPARLLPSAPGPRFAALFAAQPRWTRQQLDPYLAGLKVPGQTVEQLLLKFARACQRSPTDSTLVFVAR